MFNRTILLAFVLCLSLFSCIKDEFEDGNEAHFIKAKIGSFDFYADQAKGDISKNGGNPSYSISANQNDEYSIAITLENENVVGQYAWDSLVGFNNSMPVRIFVRIPLSQSYKELYTAEINISENGQNPLRFNASFSGKVSNYYYDSFTGKYVYDTVLIENGLSNIKF